MVTPCFAACATTSAAGSEAGNERMSADLLTLSESFDALGALAARAFFRSAALIFTSV